MRKNLLSNLLLGLLETPNPQGLEIKLTDHDVDVHVLGFYLESVL